MTIKQFIEKGIEGGWKPDDENVVATMLLTPKAWQAVGKVEGWEREIRTDAQGIPKLNIYPEYVLKMHRMIDALAEGKTIEQYLEIL